MTRKMSKAAKAEAYDVASGYTECACRDCFEIAISNNTNNPALCWECKVAGCEGDSESECARDDAYDTTEPI